MTQVIDRKWFRTASIAGAVLMAAIILFGAHMIAHINRVPSWFHTIEHFFYYGVMAVLLAHGIGRRFFLFALLAVPLVGALDEWHQLYVPGRNASAIDWAVDVFASLVGIYWYSLIRADSDGKS